MSAPHEAAVELLERSLAYTRGALADVRPELVGRPTPCAGWTLADLLAHMEDALDAFIEAAAGRVRVEAIPATQTQVDALREKACVLLGAWTAARPPTDGVAVGELGLDAPLLVATGALEITLHGWDVAQATGRNARIPVALAEGLMGVAHHAIAPLDRGPRFACPRPVRAPAPPDARLLAWTGRGPGQMTEPLAANPGEPTRRPGLAS